MIAAAGLVLLFVIVQATAFVALDELGHGVSEEGDLGARDALGLAFVQLVPALMALALVAFGVATWRGVGLRDIRGSEDVAAWNALMPVGLLVIGPTVGYVLATDGHLIDPAVGPLDALALILLAVLVAVNEELWFRGLLVDVLGGPARPWLVVVVSSLLFGVLHYAGTSATLLNALAVTLAVGVPFAIVRLRHRSLRSLIAWHAVIDIWAFLHTASATAEGDPSLKALAGALVLPTLIAIGYCWWFARARGRVEP